MDNKKITILLDNLKNSRDSLCLNDLYLALDKSVTKRTLRRYLLELHLRGQILISGANKNRTYAYNPDNSYASQNSQSIFSEESTLIIKKLEVPLYMREPHTYHKTWLNKYIPNQSYYLSQAQRNILYECGKEIVNENLVNTYIHNIYQRILIDLSYNSSRLEGNTYSLLDTKKLLLEGKAADDKLNSEKIMILNHKEAIRYLMDSINNIKVDNEAIRTLHYLLSDGLVTPENAGKIRKEAVKISGSVYIPLESQSLIEENLHQLTTKASLINNPFEQSIFLLIHISYLQAFIDVNKRTARLASNIPLIKNNLTPIAFNEIATDDYRSAMIAIYEFNEISPLVDLYTRSYIRTAKEYQATTESLGFDALRVKYRNQRRKLLHDIIKNEQFSGYQTTIIEYAQNNIPYQDHEKFILDTMNDLNNIDIATIAGLGITKSEFLNWRNNFKN